MNDEIRQELVELKKIYEAKGRNWRLEYLTELPPFAEDIARFISERAKRDLPQSQFRGDLRNPEDYVEMCGMLGYSPQNGIKEINYNHPDKSRVVFEDEKFEYTSSGASPFLPVMEFMGVLHIIDFHSHPKGNGAPSLEDSLRWKDASLVAKCAQSADGVLETFHTIIYLPSQDRLFWYVNSYP